MHDAAAMKKIPLTTGSSNQEGEKVSQKMRERERERERERDQREHSWN